MSHHYRIISLILLLNIMRIIQVSAVVCILFSAGKATIAAINGQ